MYYLNARYYSPKWRRFISPDDTAYLDPESVNGFNLYCYCNNDPVNYADPSGHDWDWGVFADVAVTVVSVLAALGAATAVTVFTGNPLLGLAAGVGAFGAINNITNGVYYTFISDGLSNIEKNGSESSYVNRYVSRWERLDYAKQATGAGWYSPNAWRFYSEYSLHMHLWNIVAPFQGKGIWLADRIGKSARHAHIEPYSLDPDWKIAVLTIIVGLLGL